MSNEMYRVIANRTDGIHTGIALGGDRFVCSTFADIVADYEKNPDIKLIVMLGEVGSRDELAVADMIKTGKVKKPVVAYVSGSFAEHLSTEVQFGHAGAKANSHEESASFKNTALREAGAHVPQSYADFGDLIEKIFKETVNVNFCNNETSADIIAKLRIIEDRKSTKFTSTISDERGAELLYDGIPLTDFLVE